MGSICAIVLVKYTLNKKSPLLAGGGGCGDSGAGGDSSERERVKGARSLAFHETSISSALRNAPLRQSLSIFLDDAPRYARQRK